MKPGHPPDPETAMIISIVEQNGRISWERLKAEVAPAIPPDKAILWYEKRKASRERRQEMRFRQTTDLARTVRVGRNQILSERLKWLERCGTIRVERILYPMGVMKIVYSLNYQEPET